MRGDKRYFSAQNRLVKFLKTLKKALLSNHFSSGNHSFQIGLTTGCGLMRIA